MRLVDLYLLRRVSLPYAASLGLIVAILSLENLSRLLLVVKDVAAPLSVLARFMLFLLPEYAGIGLLVALFLSVALAVRSASLSGEWQIFAAIGISPLRLMLVPLLLGTATAGAQLALRLHLEPAGETRLDALGGEIARGLYGFGGRPGEILSLGDHAYVSVGGVDPASGEIRDVFVSRDGIAFTARGARLLQAPDRTLRLVLRDGETVAPIDGAPRHLTFSRYEMQLPMASEPVRPRSLQEQLDRLPLAGLLERAAAERAADAHPALAALASRCAYAGFCLLLPFLAAVLGRPPVRGGRALALGLGLLLVTAFVRGTAFVEGRFPNHPLAAAGAHLLVWAVLAAWLWRLEQRHGPGAVEGAIERQVRRLGGLRRRIPPLPVAIPAPAALARLPAPLRRPAAEPPEAIAAE